MQKRIFGIAALALTLASGHAAAQSLSDWDNENDGFISTGEYYDGVSSNGYYSDWDSNSDGLIDENEFNEFGVDSSYSDWDSDSNGYLDSGEAYDGYYSYYDSNDDGMWDDSDWDSAYDDGFFGM